VTYEQAETARNRAAIMFRNMGDDEQADFFDAMSVEDYIAHKGLVLANPAAPLKNPQFTTRSKKEMATATLPADLQGLNKNEIADEVLDAEETLDSIWNETLVTDTPEYEEMSKDEKIEALETAIENIVDACNSYDEERFPIEEDDETESDFDETDTE
jgi:hypothetical protein